MSENYDCSKNSILVSRTVRFKVIEHFPNKIYAVFLMEVCSGEKSNRYDAARDKTGMFDTFITGSHGSKLMEVQIGGFDHGAT